jgi:hypothetical protein
LTTWLSVTELSKDVVLELTGKDVYDSHTALRHVHELQSPQHSIHVILPLSLRTNKGFTPWLINAKTKVRGTTVPQYIETNLKEIGDKWKQQVLQLRKQQCILFFQQSTIPYTDPVPIHAQRLSDAEHFASFDVRIAGAIKRTLMDSGATCCCMAEQMVKDLQLTVEKKEYTQDIKGVAGKVNILGTVTCPVKIGKIQIDQQFCVVKQPIAGYVCLLGQDFMARNYCDLSFTPTSVSFTVKMGEKENEKVTLKRRIQMDEFAELQSAQSIHALKFNSHSKAVWGSERKALLRDIEIGLCAAYKVVITPTASVQAGAVSSSIPIEIQKVIDSHSTETGTLRGTIPPNTHAVGYHCHIDLVPNANAVQIKQYRLTPREKEELINKVKLFIELGWIEPSTSQWCSSVLFVPKPGNKLRFCVDYRRVNLVTKDDKGPIPQTEDLIDSLQGANLFSALDLASGYYQLAIDEESRPVTAFPTPLGLFQWRVMPMGLSNAPAIFQRTMNSILAKHIADGFCLVYLDDIVIYSKSITEHAAHLDAVLTSLRDHNLFCQLPKCVWAQESIKYLGHIVSGKGILPDPDKVKALDDWGTPQHLTEHTDDNISTSERLSKRKQLVHECRRLLGFMNYFARFVPQYAQLAAPLHSVMISFVLSFIGINCMYSTD